MTTYVLHGGKTSIQNSQNDNFFEQFTKLVDKNEVTVLLCYFSRKKSQWQPLTDRDEGKIKKNTKKKVNLLVAEDSQDLLQKMDQADVLYVAGGEAEFIEPTYKKLTNLKSKLEGKVYAGSSMGSFTAAKSYVLSHDSQDSKTVHKGLGLLPIQALCHWDKEDKKEMKIRLLTEYSNEPILVLNEFEFVVFYQ